MIRRVVRGNTYAAQVLPAVSFHPLFSNIVLVTINSVKPVPKLHIIFRDPRRRSEIHFALRVPKPKQLPHCPLPVSNPRAHVESHGVLADGGAGPGLAPDGRREAQGRRAPQAATSPPGDRPPPQPTDPTRFKSSRRAHTDHTWPSKPGSNRRSARSARVLLPTLSRAARVGPGLHN
jgi:hypothetical protein